MPSSKPEPGLRLITGGGAMAEAETDPSRVAKFAMTEKAQAGL